MPFFLPGLIKTTLTVGVLAAGASSMRHGNTVNAEMMASLHHEHGTISDWVESGLLTSEERNYLLKFEYHEYGKYTIAELKRTAKYREKEMLTEQSQVYIQQWINDNDYSSDEERDRRERVVNCSKSRSPVWRGMEHYRGDIKTNGKTGYDKRFYRWDNTHNDIEVYNKYGNHLGSMDPRTGVMYKGPVSGRNIRHLL